MRRINKKAILKRLDALEQNMKHSYGAKCISLEQWLNSNDEVETFDEHISKYQDAYDVVIIDDMSIGADMYIDTSIILTHNKDDIRQFTELVNAPIEYMKKYITVFNEFFDIQANNDKQSLLDIFKERGAAFYLDFLEHYTVMTVEELINRYQQIEMHKLLEKQRKCARR